MTLEALSYYCLSATCWPPSDCIAAYAADAPPNADSEPAISPQDDVIRLFDGKTLGDCYTWLKDSQARRPAKGFHRGGRHDPHQRRRAGRVGYQQALSRLSPGVRIQVGRTDWHDAEKARDSGLLIHSNGKDGGYDGTWMPSHRSVRSSKAAWAILCRRWQRMRSGKPRADYVLRATSGAIATARSSGKRTASWRLSNEAIGSA